MTTRASHGRTLVAGVDSSTQSTKVVVVDAADGSIVREARAPHPDVTEVDPQVWWQAWSQASDGLLDGVAAVSVAGQQHGLVLLDDDATVLRPALLWNDTRSGDAAVRLTAERGGPQAWARDVGLVPVASYTVTKLRWVADHEPEVAARARAAALPHDWLTHLLSADRTGIEQLTTDRGDASGTGYWSAARGEYLPGIVREALGHDLVLPRVAGPAEAVGTTAEGAVVAPGTGDNMAAALGLDLQPGDVVVSLGTSGTAFAVSDEPAHDPTGNVAGFADATGRHLPLVCTLNAARVLGAAAQMLDVDVAALDALALSSRGSEGLVVLPFLDGERTPSLPTATGALYGWTRRTSTPEHLARAAVEGVLCSLAECVDRLREWGVEPRRVLLIGGGSRSAAVRGLAPGLLGLPVEVPEPAEYVALGAARQAAWVLSGEDRPPAWPVLTEPATPAGYAAGQAEQVRRRYREVLGAAGGLLHLPRGQAAEPVVAPVTA